MDPIKTENEEATKLPQSIARFVTEKHIKKKNDGEWEFLDSDEVLREAGLYKIEEDIQRRKRY